MLKKIVSVVRQNNVWKEKTSFCIIDAQSVKNADTDEEKGYDAGKKISGGDVQKSVSNREIKYN